MIHYLFQITFHAQGLYEACPKSKLSNICTEELCKTAGIFLSLVSGHTVEITLQLLS